jgi:hypothetical protein
MSAFSRLASLRRLALSAVLVLAGLQAGGRLQASTELRKEMAVLAKSLKECLVEYGEDTVAMGQFVGPPQLGASGGPLLAQLLAEELIKLKVAVKTRANLGIKGEYQDVIDHETKQMAVQIKVKLVDRNKTLLDLDRGVLSNPDIAVLLGVTAHLPPKGSAKVRNDVVKASTDEGKVFLDGTWAAADKNGPYYVQVRVNQKPRTPFKRDGQAFVSIDEGEVYTIRLCNTSEYDAAVSLAIDGINIFTFSEVTGGDGTPAYEYIIVPRKSTVEIKGWHKTNEVSEGFQVTELAKSAAAFLRNTAKVGTISASFHAAWVKNGPPPADELPGRSASATGFGPPVNASYRIMPREIGVLRDIVCVRYSR